MAIKNDSEKLKEILWQTIVDVRSGKMSRVVANAVAKSARELLNGVRTELAATAYVGLANPKGVTKFFGIKDADVRALASRRVEVEE